MPILSKKMLEDCLKAHHYRTFKSDFKDLLSGGWIHADIFEQEMASSAISIGGLQQRFGFLLEDYSNYDVLWTWIRAQYSEGMGANRIFDRLSLGVLMVALRCEDILKTTIPELQKYRIPEEVLHLYSQLNRDYHAFRWQQLNEDLVYVDDDQMVDVGSTFKKYADEGIFNVMFHKLRRNEGWVDPDRGRSIFSRRPQLHDVGAYEGIVVIGSTDYYLLDAIRNQLGSRDVHIINSTS